MDDRLENKGRGGFLNQLLILSGFFLSGGSLLGPTVTDWVPAGGFTIWSTPDSFYRVVPAEESIVDHQLVFMLIGVVLLFAGIIGRCRVR